MSNLILKRSLLFLIIVLSIGANVARAQTTEFTYQGKLTDNNMSPTANYDFQFSLFSVGSGGTAIGTVQRLGVAVSNGIFTVQLDFGAQFDGTARYLEIAVRPAGNSGGFQQLLPRQPITSAPYNIRSLSAANADMATTATTSNNALQLGGVAANQFVQTTDSRLSDARNPLAGSVNYIQNRSTMQTVANFNIDGTGRADIFNAATQYNLGGTRVLSIDGINNVFAGAFTGQNNQGADNSFFGRSAGFSNTTGSENTFSGYRSGFSNTTGHSNSFFGSYSGESNQGSDNAFFGQRSGNANTTGGNDSFFGVRSGISNKDGSSNAFFGTDAGGSNTNADANSFFGNGAGYSTTVGNNNSFFGELSGDGNITGANNSFFGSNSGIGNTGGSGNVFIGKNAGSTNITGDFNTIIGNNADVVGDNLNHATAIGAGAVVASSNTIYMGRTDGSDTVRIPGAMVLGMLGGAGSTTLCRNASNFIATCSSSLRYKTNVQSFLGGLDVVRRLRPITFDWKEGGMHDVGFAAEEVNQVEPLLTTTNASGEIEGIKYGQITTVLVNAVNEQQTQIAAQQKQIAQQQSLIENLRKLVCVQNAQADVCKEEQK
ncbi:MAG: tail fiber domain-containing protein [Pyrinomonadaceae bacterium]